MKRSVSSLKCCSINSELVWAVMGVLLRCEVGLGSKGDTSVWSQLRLHVSFFLDFLFLFFSCSFFSSGYEIKESVWIDL